MTLCSNEEGGAGLKNCPIKLKDDGSFEDTGSIHLSKEKFVQYFEFKIWFQGFIRCIIRYSNYKS